MARSRKMGSVKRVIDLSAPEKNYTQVSGSGYCGQSDMGEATARRFMKGSCNSAQIICSADASCVGYACADDTLNIVLYTANSCTNNCDELSWLKDPSMITRTHTEARQPWWDNAKCYRANTGANMAWVTVHASVGSTQVVVSNVSSFAASDVVTVGMREVKVLSSVHSSADGSSAGTLSFAQALSAPFPVGTAVVILGHNDTWIGTQQVTLSGDYTTVVGNQKAEFLEGCSNVTGVTCTDVQAGSIVLSLQGDVVSIAQAASGIQESGLSVPGFANLSYVQTSSAQTDCTQYTSSSTCDQSVCHWTLVGTCKERDYKQFDYGTYVDGPVIRQDSRCDNAKNNFSLAKALCTADPQCAFLLAEGCGTEFRTCSFDITDAISGAISGSDSCTITKPTCTVPAVGMDPYNTTTAVSSMDLSRDNFSISGLSCNPGYGGIVVTQVCSQAATAFSVSGCLHCSNYSSEEACTAAHCSWTGVACWQAVQQYSHLDYGLYVDGPRVDDDVYKETFCSDTSNNFTEAKRLCDADASCQFLHNSLCDDVGWRTCSTDVNGVSHGDYTACTIVKRTNGSQSTAA